MSTADQKLFVDPEVRAMRDAYAAISSRPIAEHDRILEWLIARLRSDAIKEMAHTSPALDAEYGSARK